MAISAALSALCAIIPGSKAALKLSAKLGVQFLKKFNRAIPLWLLQQIAHGTNSVGENIGSEIVEAVLNGAASPLYYTTENLYNWYNSEELQICKGYLSIQNSIQNNYKKCEKEKEKEKDEEEIDEPRNEDTNKNDEFTGKGSTPQIDPSGYVYEAVLSNRIEGVTTTCYQKMTGEDMYGDDTEETVVWNAADYSQANPQMTDATGFYRWDVPQGMWQVKYEKEGYETAYSDWLPVPPPQLDVNIGMKQSTPPTVKQMRGYESVITIETSKYMRPETMTTENITVTRNGQTEKGNIEQVNAEKAPLGEETYVSKVKFVPESSFNTTDLVVVTVHKEVESYCGVNMEKDHVETVKIEPEVKSIICDSVVTVPYQGERELRILVLPKDASAGKTLKVKSSSQMIASVNVSEVTIDQDGAAMLTLGGELPGGAVLDFSVEGTDVTATAKVEVVIGRELVAMPVANIQSGVTVEGGTQIVLTCETEGATIYYSLDGSCPCDVATRIKYDGPITITTNVILKVIAVKEGMDDSDIATFVYVVNGIENVISGMNIHIVYQNGAIEITGAKGANCRIYDLNGFELVGCVKAGQRTRISVPERSVYVVSVQLANGKSFVHKLMKK